MRGIAGVRDTMEGSSMSGRRPASSKGVPGVYGMLGMLGLALSFAWSASAAQAASISGTVKDAHGDPITTSDICVTAYGNGPGQSYGYTQSASDGKYTVSNLAAGSYTVSFSDCPSSSRN